MGSLTTISSEVVSALFIVQVEAMINAKISKLYSVPVAGSPPLLEMIARDLSMYRILSRRVYPQERASNSDWPDRFKESMELLDQIANGEMTLLTSSGVAVSQLSTTGAVPWSNTSNYTPTFLDDGDDIGAVIDPDKQDDASGLRT
jgi:phage gp36-like protein